MDVVFFVQIGFSYGEREHALSFARQVRKAGHRPHFVVSERIADYFREAGFEPQAWSSPEAGVEIVRRLDPALIIGCEIFNFSSEQVRGLAETGRPIATMDGTTLGFEINTDAFRNPGMQRPLWLPETYHSLRPCPVNDIAMDTDRIFHWRLYPDASRVEKDAAIHASLGLDASRRTVLLAIAPWASSGARHHGLTGYHDSLLNRIVEGLQACGEPIQFLVVAKADPVSTTRGRVDVRIHGLLPNHVYDHVLCSCDAIVSDNIVQTSVSKAIVIGTPHLIIQNMPPDSSRSASGQGGMLPSELPYRCNMAPLKQVFPVDREYSQIVELAEYGDPADIREKLVATLTRGYYDAERRERRREYVERLARLAEPADILARILGSS